MSSSSASSTGISSASTLPKLERRIGYQFSERSLLERALTHKSAGPPHNERLEFLGDAILGYVIAQALYRTQRDLAEDRLSLLRAQLVRRDTLAEIANELDLGAFLVLGVGERRSGGRQRPSILADAVEAVIGAVAEDGGIEAAQGLVLALFASRLDELDVDAAKDPKTRLQEQLQAAARPLPVYTVIATEGSDHARRFTVRCAVESLELETTGQGNSRREAEKAAAASMIETIADND